MGAGDSGYSPSGMQHYRAAVESAESPLQRDLRETRTLSEWVCGQLYSLDIPGRRAVATTAVAAAAAEAAYRLSDELPQWGNDTSAAWRTHLADVWEFLSGDRSKHYELSSAVASFLTSPLNHNEGQDGPDDFDRPQTVASYSAALSAIAWGVDFAVTAVGQIFQLLDLKYDGEFSEEREEERANTANWVRKVVNQIVAAEAPRGGGMTPDLLAAIRA